MRKGALADIGGSSAESGTAKVEKAAEAFAKGAPPEVVQFVCKHGEENRALSARLLDQAGVKKTSPSAANQLNNFYKAVTLFGVRGYAHEYLEYTLEIVKVLESLPVLVRPEDRKSLQNLVDSGAIRSDEMQFEMTRYFDQL